MLSKEDGLKILNAPDAELPELMRRAREIRDKHLGKRVQLCSIVNAKSGKCSENCAYCAQSVHHHTRVEEYDLLTVDEIVSKGIAAQKNGACCFGIVTSGKALPAQDIEKVIEAIRRLQKADIFTAVSLGILNKQTLQRLKDAGLKRYHHNLETAESYFTKICTTHTYIDRVNTARAVKEVGLELCCGGIVGMGETKAQRVELVMAITELDPDSVPLNFLNPIQGTALQAVQPMSRVDICRTIVLFRVFLPDKNISMIGGREQLLGDKQDLVFESGSNGILIGNYLTTSGNSIENDYELLRAAGLGKL